MISSADLKRLLLDALAYGYDYDGFRTHLRAKLKEHEAKGVALDAAAQALRTDMRAIKPREMVATIVNNRSI